MYCDKDVTHHDAVNCQHLPAKTSKEKSVDVARGRDLLLADPLAKTNPMTQI